MQPGAEDLMLPAADGSRYGFRGFATIRVRPEMWARLHERSGGAGVRGALLAATREAAAELELDDADHPGASTTRDLEQALSKALSRCGLDLRRLDFEGLDYLTVDAGDAGPPSRARLLMIGLDGADWAILDPLLAQGRLPHLKRLIDNGARAKLLTVSPMLSPVIWTSVATGVEPSRHGVLDFLVEDPDTGSRQPVTSAQRQVPAVWELLSRSGIDVGVTAWWASWPADPVRGYIVSDRLAYQLFGYRADPEDAQGKTWPPDLYASVRPQIVPPESVPWSDVARYVDASPEALAAATGDEKERVDGLRTLIASGETYLSVARSLRERFDPSFEAVYFEGTDTIGHLFMPFRPPRLPGIADEDVKRFGATVDRYYETADRYIGLLLADRGPEWTVMILSDHGFASDATRPQTTDSRIGHGGAADWHRRFGVLILSGAHVRPGARIEEAAVYDVAPTILALFGLPVPESWPGRVLGGALTAEFLEEHPVRYRPDEPQRDDLQAIVEEDPAAADLIDKLQTLGYISAGSDGTDSVTARNNAGVAFLAEGRFADAEREFRAGLEAEPGAAMLRMNLGVALRFQGRTADAQRLFEEAMNNASTRRMAGNQLARIHLEGDDIEAAERITRAVLSSEPGAAESHTLHGRILEQRGRPDDARRAYLEAARLDPDVAFPRNHLGNLAKRAGDLEQAETWYLRAIEADPYFMGSYNNLAIVYQDRGEMDRALDLYDRALAKAPRNAELLNNVGSWYYASGDLERASSLFQRAAAADPRYPSPLNNLAGIAIRENRIADAERLLRQALELDANYGDARINLALCHMANGNADGARQELRAAAGDPRAAGRAWLQLGFVELDQGFVDAAIAALEQARDSGARGIPLWNGLGAAYRMAGRDREAIEVWSRSLELEPQQARIRDQIRELQELQ